MTAIPVDVSNRALSAEHAAVYAYGVIIAQLAGQPRRDATAALDHHRSHRDRLRAYVIEGGGTPAEPSPAYQLPTSVLTPVAAQALAANVERLVALAYGDLVAAADGDLRGYAAKALAEAAVRETGWRGQAPQFPGLVRPNASPSPSP
jgi:Domain of unknown function (DUF4439)